MFRYKHFKLQYYETKYITDRSPTSNATSSTPNWNRIKTTWYIYIYIYDTDDAIQQQADDNAAELDDLHLRKKRNEKECLDIFTNDLSNPSQIDNMIASSSKSNIRGNLRGTSSASAAAASQEDDFMSIASQGEEDEDIHPKVTQLIQNIEIDKLEQTAQKHIQHLSIEIRDNLKEGIHTTKASDTFKERLDIQNRITEINKLNNI